MRMLLGHVLFTGGFISLLFRGLRYEFVAIGVGNCSYLLADGFPAGV